MNVAAGKQKFHISNIIVGLAALSFGLSAASVFPENWVEAAYSDGIFPIISHISGLVADAVPFSWFDVGILCGVGILIYSVRRRNVRVLISAVSIAYLWLFWSWGLNYHRPALETKLDLRGITTTREEFEDFAATAASELNRLWPLVSRTTPDRTALADRASRRVRTVVSDIEGREWRAAGRIKVSYLAEAWFRMAGIDGMFNPMGHEPIVSSSVLSFELPFVMAHELAHVRGIPNEGDANLVAAFATLSDDDPAFQYSGWFHLWLYLRNAERDLLLDPGPRTDLQAYFERVQSQQIRWVSNIQTAVLDWYLKANDVEEGITSYARFVELTIAARKRGLI